MKPRQFSKIITIGAALLGTIGVSSAAQAHVGVYVAGMSGVAVDTTAVNATYTVGASMP